MIRVIFEKLKSSQALAFAWLIEIIAVFMGFILAAYAAYEIESKSSIIALIISMLPFIALSIIELTKIPLVALAFKVHAFKWRFLAILALLCITTATFENFIFGFERGFEQRLLAIKELEDNARKIENNKIDKAEKLNDLEKNLASVESQIAAVENNLKELANNDRDKKEQLKLLDDKKQRISTEIKDIELKIRSLDQRESSDKDRLVDSAKAKNDYIYRQIEELNKQIATVTDNKDKEYSAALVRCAQNARVDPNFRCTAGSIQIQKNREVSRLNSEKAELNKQMSFDSGQNVNLSSERKEYNNDLDNRREELSRVESEQNKKFEEITAETQKEREKISADRSSLEKRKEQLISEINNARSESREASYILNDTNKKLEDYKSKSQMHRLSAIFYGNSDQANLDRTKNIFIISLSVIVALLGTVVATMHYASLLPIEKTNNFSKLSKSIRGLIVRLRKKNSVIKTVEVEKIVEKEKPVEVEKVVEKPIYIDRVKLIYLAKDATEEEIAKVRAEAMSSEIKDNVGNSKSSINA